MGSRTVLAFRHIPFEDIGNIRPVLESRGVTVDCVDLYRGDAVPDIAEAAGLIFMGGPMCANDDLPCLAQEIELIRTAAHRGQPVFGVCLGSQLIAKALGGRVYPNPEKEIGWYEIQLTREGAIDPLFAGIPPRPTVFQWHGDTFDLPTGATLLASSVQCRNQAFRLSGSIYGVQFHPEMTPEMIGEWCRQDQHCAVPELLGPIDPHQGVELPSFCDTIFGQWTNLFG